HVIFTGSRRAASINQAANRECERVSQPDLKLRPPGEKDVDVLAKLIFEAFASIHDKHNFPRDFPSMEPAMGLARAWIAHPAIWGVLSERDGKVVGCNFL